MSGRSHGPIGFFVHHQGRGHAERVAALANALVPERSVTLFCAKPDIFPALREGIEVRAIPSLFEPKGTEPPRLAQWPTPDHLHCAPLGWATVTEAVGTIAAWLAEAQPALFISDVSAEIGQLCRIASVPHIAVLQHGDRADPGHLSHYESAVGILAPYHSALEQTGRPEWMRAKTHYSPGLGIDLGKSISRDEARQTLGLPAERRIVLVLAGGGGTGTPNTPLTLAARAAPEETWHTIGTVASEWHETPPGNLVHHGWVDKPETWIAAADLVVSSAGNTTVHMVLAAGRPWIVVPEWRYFDEQLCKARALATAKVAAVAEHWPSHGAAWTELKAEATAIDPDRQTALVGSDAATATAKWLSELAVHIWAGSGSATGHALEVAEAQS